MLKRSFVVILLLSSSLWARNAVGTEDGSDWRKFSQDYKYAWIDGFVSAMSDAQYGLANLCVFRLNLRGETKEGKDCTDEARSFNYEKIMYGQFVDGMDAFYKDFRNMEYPIDEAIRIVRDQINGRSQEDIERELVAWRHCHASKSECGTPARPLMPN